MARVYLLEKNMQKQVLKILSEHKGKMALFCILSLIHSVIVFLVPLVSGYLVDNILREQDVTKVIIGVCVSFAIVMLSPLTNLLKNRLSVNLSLEITKKLRLKLFDRIIDATMSELDKTTKGAIISKFVNDSKEIANFAVNYYVDMISNILLIVIIFMGMMRISSFMSLILISSFIIYYMLSSMLNRKFSVYQASLQKKQDDFVTVVNQSMDGIVTIKTNNLHQYAKKRYKNVVNDITIFNRKICGLAIWVGNFSNIYTAFATSIIYGIGAIMVIRGNITVGEVISLGLFFQTVASPITKIISLDSEQKSKRPIFERVRELLSIDVEKYEEQCGVVKAKEISFSNVSFSYSHKMSISNLSFEINEPGLYGIVGESGSGKSTVAKLLLNLYKPSEGVIKINGVNIEEMGRKKLSQQLAYSPQDSYLFNDTIINNIRGNNSEITEDDIVAICKELGLHEKIISLPDGYSSVLNENTNLSGGEKRRMALARTFVANSDVLILDEPLVGVDYNNLMRVHNVIEKCSTEKIVLLITHELDVLKNAKKILHINAGELCNIGVYKDIVKDKRLVSGREEG